MNCELGNSNNENTTIPQQEEISCLPPQNDLFDMPTEKLTTTRKFTKEEELILAHHMLLGDIEARNKLFFDNFWIVRSIAKKFKKQTRDIEQYELEGAGIIALLEALNNFQPSHNCRVSTYASRRVFLSVWNLIVGYRSGISIPKYMYKKIASHIKGDGLTDEEFAKANKFTLTQLAQFTSITQIGIPILSSFESFNSEMSGDQLDIDDIIPTSANLSSQERTTPEEVKLELKLFGEGLERYAQEHLTRQQYKVLSLTVIPYLKGEPHMTVVEVATHTHRTFQAVDQLISYIRIRMVQSNTGKKYLRIIDETMKFLKTQRSKKQ